eukprot:9443510-Pyramimonas_sp.AAC.1
MDAVIVAPAGGARRPAMRCVDFFVVPRVIAGAAMAEIVQDIPISPHCPVRLVFPRVEPVADV